MTDVCVFVPDQIQIQIDSANIDSTQIKHAGVKDVIERLSQGRFTRDASRVCAGQSGLGGPGVRVMQVHTGCVTCCVPVQVWVHTRGVMCLCRSRLAGVG